MTTIQISAAITFDQNLMKKFQVSFAIRFSLSPASFIVFAYPSLKESIITGYPSFHPEN